MLIVAGLSEEEVEKIREIDEVVPVSEEFIDWTVEKIIEEKPRAEEYRKIQCSRIVIMHGIERERISGIMRAVKEAIGGHIIFATTTPTSLKWSMRNLIGELEEEDAYFRGKR